ncbi:MAG: DNA topoisomerase IV subunit B [Alphaproteobacteria bacterium]
MSRRFGAFPPSFQQGVRARMAVAKRKDLFDFARPDDGYSAKDIEVLEGLEPVRRRPGMYVGGTDERALHHLFAEVLDNAMDEAVAGHASMIEVRLEADGRLSVRDNGRGIPVDPHPRFKNKSALEVIMTTLHAGGKFSGKVYETSGGLHGVGVSVVNALSDELTVEVSRGGTLYRQTFSRGKPSSKLKQAGKTRRRGTLVTFHPDPEIFGDRAAFRPARLYRMSRSKAYLFGGVEIRWWCAPELLKDTEETPQEAVLRFPGGLKDFLADTIGKNATVTADPFTGSVKRGKGKGAVEWAVAWYGGADGFLHSYCNTVPTSGGGTHEQGLRAGLTRSLKAHGERVGNKRAQIITADDVMGSAGALLSVFIGDPEFQGQTKDRLASAEAARLVETVIRDHFDHWLSGAPSEADKLLDWVIGQAEDRLRRRQEKDISRKTAMRRLRLPGKLTDCSRAGASGTEIFLVEGDSAGGSAKQARNRETQAILPLRGKILNVASAGADKLRANQELSDLIQALGCGVRDRFREEDLRYEKVIIMTDADVDGAHIASLLITFFFREMPGLIRSGHLYLAVPPLYKLSHGSKIAYARDEAHRDRLLKTEFRNSAKVHVDRFKGLGEMMPAQLKETTMMPGKRTLLRVSVDDAAEAETGRLVERLMGRKAELRFRFIQENAGFVEDLDI